MDTNSISKLKELYAGLVQCSRCESDCIVRGDNERPPRGFWFNPQEDPKILVVALNPAGGSKPSKDKEMGFYGSKQGIDFVNAELDYVGQRIRGEITGSNYFENLYKALDLSGFKSIPLAYTNLVKCETRIGFSDNKLHKKEKEIIVENCFDKFLKKEILLFRPKLILTYGNESFTYLHSKIPIKVLKLPRRGKRKIKNWEEDCKKLKKDFETHKEFKKNL